MKKALTISIAQTLFTIEEDAYTKLDHYLSSIRSHFAHTEGHDDIISDIEARISEKFAESKKHIITLAEVEAVMASMGKVEDFAGADDSAGQSRSGSGAHAGDTAGNASAENKKKLYRNPDDKILAGVASGLGAYFGVDALWMRLAFVILTIFTNGFGILLYIVLVFVMPEAKTAAQKLEMEGSPVTIETMSESVRENFKKKVKPTVEEAMGKFREKHGSQITRILAWPFKALKAVCNAIFKTVFPLLRIIFGSLMAAATLGGILFFSFMAPLVLINSARYFDTPLATIMTTPLLYLAVIGIYLAIVIPLLLIFMLSIGMIRRKNIISGKLALTLLGIWFVAAVCGGVTAINGAQKVDDYTRTNPLYEKTTRGFAVRSDLTKKLEVQDGIKLTLVQIGKDEEHNKGIVGSSSEPNLQVTARARIIDDFTLRQDGQTLILERKPRKSFCLFCDLGNIEATLYLPAIDGIAAKHGADITVDSWISPSPLAVNLENGSHGEMDLSASELNITVIHGGNLELTANAATSTIEAENGSSIEISGTSTEMIVTAIHGSRIDASDSAVSNAQAKAENGSRILLGIIAKNLDAIAKHGSRITYEGNPIVKKNEQNGSSIDAEDEPDEFEIEQIQ